MLEGAVYRPEAEIAPVPEGLIDQVTDVFEVPETVGVNCWVCPAERLLVDGAMLTVIGGTTGSSVTVADPATAEFEVKVAVTVTVCCAVTVDGAV